MEDKVPLTGTVDIGPLAEKVTARLDVVDAEIQAAAAKADAVANLFSDAAATTARATDALRQKTDALAQRVDELAQRGAELERLVAAIKTPRPTEINLLDLGVRLNDPSVDNGPALNAALAKLGAWTENEPGWLDTSLYLPGGACWYRTPLSTAKRTSTRLRGNGLSLGISEPHHRSHKPGAQCGPVSRLIYAGPADGRALTLRGYGDIFDGVVLQRGPFEVRVGETKIDRGSVGIEVAGDNAPPTGKHELRSLALYNFDRAVALVNAPASTHADESLIGNCLVENCRTFLYCENIQALHWHIQKLQISWGVETVFDYQRGGGLSVDSMALMSPATLLRCYPENNTGGYKIGWLWVDNGARGWRVVEQLNDYPLKVRIDGYLQSSAQPGPRAVVLGAKTPDVVIDLHDGATGRPWAWKAEPRRPTLSPEPRV